MINITNLSKPEYSCYFRACAINRHPIKDLTRGISTWNIRLQFFVLISESQIHHYFNINNVYNLITTSSPFTASKKSQTQFCFYQHIT